MLTSQDMEIEAANKKLRTALDSAAKASERMASAQVRVVNEPVSDQRRKDLEKAARGKEKADAGYNKALDASISAVGKGSGRVMLVLPAHRVAEGGSLVS